MIIYKTTNLINGKQYIGKDKYNDPNYLGSGHLLLKAIRKYGKQNFKKDILEVCSSYQNLNERERYWIDKYDATHDDNFYNIVVGGHGGDLWEGRRHTEEYKNFKSKMKVINSDPAYHPNPKHKESTKENQRIAAKDRYTLSWFQERYGIDNGKQRFDQRNQMLSERGLTVEQIELFESISKESIIKLIASGYRFDDIVKHYKTTSKRLNKRIKQLFDGATYRQVEKHNRGVGYLEKCEKLSKQTSGKRNGMYKFIDIDSFKSDVLSGMTLTELELKYKMTYTGIVGKLNEAFNTTKLTEARKMIN